MYFILVEDFFVMIFLEYRAVGIYTYYFYVGILFLQISSSTD